MRVAGGRSRHPGRGRAAGRAKDRADSLPQLPYPVFHWSLRGSNGESIPVRLDVGLERRIYMNSGIDDALDRLRGTNTEVIGGGDPNHGPMAVEALVALGRHDITLQWADRYRRRLDMLPGPTLPIAAEAWRDALGRAVRIGDWAAFFRREIAFASWSAALRVWLPRLLPAAISAGMHGLIRTAHIARALGERTTPPRLEELAMALGYWAASYRELPGPAHLLGLLPIEDALERMPRILRARLPDGMPRDVVLAVAAQPGFLAAVQRAREPSSVEAGLSALTELGARVYLTDAASNPLVLLHTVTGPAALRLLLPHLSAGSQRDALAGMIHCSAAWISAYGSENPLVSSDQAVSVSRDEIVARCIDTADPHAIKFVEACIREDQINPKPVYMAAALDWATRLRAARTWTTAERGAAGLGFG
jgi:Questin oxidase-like